MPIYLGGLLKILLTCLGGMTSSVLANKLKKQLKKEGYSVRCQNIMNRKDVQRIIKCDKDFTIAYMHINGLTIEDRKCLIHTFDKILVAPQAQYLVAHVKESLGKEVDESLFVNIPGKSYANVDVDDIISLFHDH